MSREVYAFNIIKHNAVIKPSNCTLVKEAMLFSLQFSYPCDLKIFDSLVIKSNSALPHFPLRHSNR
ncbi:hypothetical protein PCAR4_570283 [Paraburkholderia caribensis]|nr:hypothetical protein PCAR4_570283 [Paraburkholderia caribensis]